MSINNLWIYVRECEQVSGIQPSVAIDVTIDIVRCDIYGARLYHMVTSPGLHTHSNAITIVHIFYNLMKIINPTISIKS